MQLTHSVCISRVDYVNDGICVLVVAPPIGPDGCLPTQVPHLESQTLVLYSFNVKSDCYEWKNRFPLVSACASIASKRCLGVWVWASLLGTVVTTSPICSL